MDKRINYRDFSMLIALILRVDYENRLAAERAARRAA